MSEQPDKLFKDKLEHFQQPTPARALTRIENGLSKKNNRQLWLKAAAIIPLIATVSFLLWFQHSGKHVEQPIVKKYPHTKNQPAIQPHQEDSTFMASNAKNEAAEMHEVRKEKAVANALVSKPHQEEKIGDEIPKEVHTQSVETDEIASQQTAILGETPDEVTPSPENINQQGGFKLVINVNEVNAKYLNKTSVAQATSTEEKSSGLKKLLDKASDLKNNQDPIGELRQMKNELLALNIQGNKTQEQNK